MPRWDTDTGWMEFSGNELTIGSKNADPPKLRLTSTVQNGCAGGGALSFNMRRGDVDEEIVLLQGKQDERVRGQINTLQGELTLHLRNGAVPDADTAMTKKFEWVWDSVIESQGKSYLVSSDGRYQAYMQSDGNFVIYDTRPWKALWSWMTGTI